MSRLSILLATDFSAESLRMPAAALELFGDRLGEVILLHVIPRSLPIFPVMNSGSILAAPPLQAPPESDSETFVAQEQLDRIRTEFGDRVRVRSLVKYGFPATVICETASGHQADIVMLASHGRRFLRRLLQGSTVQYVMNEAPCHVVILRHESNARPARRQRSSLMESDQR